MYSREGILYTQSEQERKETETLSVKFSNGFCFLFLFVYRFNVVFLISVLIIRFLFLEWINNLSQQKSKASLIVMTKR